ncbi:MAG: hypothetical protein AMS22_13270 [Thiotrichales bacterium SG8_50]|nr:MAG: hypothetical protein AMS22_13270 [Thiotrichales bacterium SG8_50]
MVAPVAQADLKMSGRVAGSLVSQDGNIQFQDAGNTRLQMDASTDSGFYARMALDMRLGRDSHSHTLATTSNPGTGSTTDPFVTGKSTAYNSLWREQYVGLKGGFGALQFGRMGVTGKNIEGDPFIATFLELRGNAMLGGSGDGQYGSSSFVDNVIEYNNKAGDATFGIQYSPVSNPGAKNTANAGLLAASVKAKLAGAGVWAAYNNLGDNGTYYKVGGDMSFGDAKVKLAYQSYDPGTAVTNWNVGAEFKLGAGMVDVTYADKGASGADAFYRVAYMQKAGKQARWWVGYAQNGNNGVQGASPGANVATYGAGARVDF